MYIWDYDKATEEMKPQVSCFTLISTPAPLLTPPTRPPQETEKSLWWVSVQTCK